MINIQPIGEVPDARQACIDWADQEWSAVANFTAEEWVEEFQRIDQSPTDQVFVAHSDAVPVGMVWLLAHEDVYSHRHLTPWLSGLVVDPAYRRTGIARALVAYVESRAATEGTTDLHLLTVMPNYYFYQGWDVIDTAILGQQRVFVMKKALVNPDHPAQDQA